MGSRQICGQASPRAEEVQRPRDRQEHGTLEALKGSQDGWRAEQGRRLEVGSGGWQGAAQGWMLVLVRALAIIPVQ